MFNKLTDMTFDDIFYLDTRA